MIAIGALLLDAYRELNAKRLFWISMMVSMALVLLFAGVAPVADGVSIFGWHSPLELGFGLNNTASFYKFMYVNLGIGLWITWAGMILAVASTAGMFPDFLASGAVELYLARPISRLKLFLVKYVCGLLFVALQVSAFSAASFLVIGIRGGIWEPGLFLAVPLAVLMFSYLFGVCALAGVLTRSTVAAMLITLAFWFAMAGMQYGERLLLIAQTADEANAAQLDRQIADTEAEIASTPPQTQPQSQPSADPTAAGWGAQLARLFDRDARNAAMTPGDRLNRYRMERSRLTDEYALPHELIYWADAPLPKTTATVAILQRQLLTAARLPRPLDDEESADPPGFAARRRDRQLARFQVDEIMRRRPAWQIIGSSLGFEAAAVTLAAWLFCRRDY
jgi:hypothetical protein